MESDLESWAREEIAKAGGWMLKWVSPGQKGVPDDIVFWPDGTKHLLEFKDGDEPLDFMQSHVAKRLGRMNIQVYVARNREWITKYIAINARPSPLHSA